MAKFTKALIALISLLLLVPLLPLFSGKVFVFDDLFTFNLPFRFIYSLCLKNGASFFWTSQIYNGFFLHAEGQIGMLHPLHLFLYSMLPLPVAFQLELWIGYPFAFLGCLLMLKRWGIRVTGRLIGAYSFAFGSFLISHHHHLNCVQIISHLPWLIWCWDILLTEQTTRARFRAFLGVIVLTGSQSLLGYPQYLMYCGMAEALYIVLFLLQRDRGRWENVLSIFLAKAGGYLLGAAQLLPSFFMAKGNPLRERTLEFNASGSFAPQNIFQWFSPYLFRGRVYATSALSPSTAEWAAYEGALGLIVIIALFFSLRSERSREWPVRVGMLLVSVAFFFCFGRYNPLFPLYARLPLVAFFRFPSRILVLYGFGLSILVAVFIDKMEATIGSANERPLSFHPFWLGVFFCSGPAYWFLVRNLAFLSPTVSAALAPFETVLLFSCWLVLIFALLIIALEKRSLILFRMFLILAVADKAYYGISFLWNVPPQKVEVSKDHRPLEFPGFRELGSSYDNSAILSGKFLALGYTGFEPGRFLNYASPSPQLLSLIPINGIIFKKFRLLSRELLSSKTGPDLTGVDVATVAVVDRAWGLRAGKAGGIEVLKNAPGSIQLRVHAEDLRLLAISESFHRGWKATIGGTPVKVERAYWDFLALPIPKGDSLVNLSFEPEELKLGIKLSLATLALIVLFFLWYPASVAKRLFPLPARNKL